VFSVAEYVSIEFTNKGSRMSIIKHKTKQSPAACAGGMIPSRKLKDSWVKKCQTSSKQLVIYMALQDQLIYDSSPVDQTDPK